MLISIPKIRSYLGSYFKKWENGYRRFARMRGFKTFNDVAYHKRGFIECWAEPGFHCFWQVWNPGIAYLFYPLFIKLGGLRRWCIPTVLTFTINGLMHTLVIWPFASHWSFTLIATFSLFGILTILSRYLESILQQEKWPGIFNVAMNIMLVTISFDLGFRFNNWMYHSVIPS